MLTEAALDADTKEFGISARHYILLVNATADELPALHAAALKLRTSIVCLQADELVTYQGDFERCTAVVMDIALLHMAAQLRGRYGFGNTPLLFLTAAGDSQMGLIDAASALGGIDFLARPLIQPLLEARLRFLFELHRSERRLRRARRRQASDASGSNEIRTFGTQSQPDADFWQHQPGDARAGSDEDRYRNLFESIDEGFVVYELLYDANGEVADLLFLEVNPAFEEHTGLRDAVGKTVLELEPNPDKRWLLRYDNVVKTGVPLHFLRHVRSMDYWFEVSANRLGGPGSRKVAVLLNNITSRKRSEETLRRLAVELAEADRRKSEFLATLAHELRNPLAPLRNGLQVMRMSVSKPDVLERTRAMMERQVNVMVHLIDDLLDIARISTGKVELKKERVELSTVVSRAVETSQPLIDACNHQLTVELPDEDLQLDADPIRIAQVLSNLLNNAAKYTDSGGLIKLAVRRDGEEVVISVMDNGIGIPTAWLSSVFDMFRQVGRHIDHAQGGLGIGLTVVRGLVTLHGGSVSASSPGPGQGSTFVVRLPLAARKSNAHEPEPEHGAAHAAAANHLSVLVVDDNRDAADSLAMVLELGGYETRVAYDGDQALKIARESVPRVIFLDIGMPKKNGYEVARELRQLPGMQETILVALTGWGAEDDRRRSRDAGFNHHLTKPAELSAVEALLAELSDAAGSAKTPQKPA